MTQEYHIMRPSLLTTDGEALRNFLMEDIGYGDLSSQTIDGDVEGEGVIFVKEKCILAGLEEACGLFGILNVPVAPLKHDGDEIEKNVTVLKINGNLTQILAVERVALNILSRMSGIATQTNELVMKTREINPHLIIACTRKTTPGFRFFEKKAVVIGGGDSHRFRLDDSIILKDNHLKVFESIREGVMKAKQSSFTKKIEVEVEDLTGALEAAEAGAEIVMLDNMDPSTASECYLSLKERYPKIIVEISGGITPENITQYARHADVISLGFLTHSYRSIDYSLELND